MYNLKKVTGIVESDGHTVYYEAIIHTFPSWRLIILRTAEEMWVEQSADRQRDQSHIDSPA